jgi:hypothetical protein
MAALVQHLHVKPGIGTEGLPTLTGSRLDPQGFAAMA